MTEELLTNDERKELKKLGMSDAEIDTELARITEEYYDDSQRSPGTPQAADKDSLLKFTRDILNVPNEEHDKISRAGNVRDDELGKLLLPTRAYLDIAGYAETETYDSVAKYLRSKSNIIFNTSLSRKGFFVKLPFSRTSISQNLGTPTKTIQKGLFGKKEVVTGMSEE